MHSRTGCQKVARVVTCHDGKMELTVYGVHQHCGEKHKAGLSTEQRHILERYMLGGVLKPKQAQIIL